MKIDDDVGITFSYVQIVSFNFLRLFEDLRDSSSY